MGRLALLALFASLAIQPQDPTLAIIDVSVVPMDRPVVLDHQTVVVRSGRISAIGPVESVRVSGSAQRIDGRGKFLMPGMTDMHVHFSREALPANSETQATSTGNRQPGVPASASVEHDLENRAYSLIYLANGVTTVRNMWGSKTIVELAHAIDAGRVIGPHIYSTGPITDGNPPVWQSTRIVETQLQADEVVRADKRDSYVAIKVYSLLSKTAYADIITAARRDNLPVVGHVPSSVGLEAAIAARQDSIEHLDSFLRFLAPGTLTAADAVQQADLTRLGPVVRAIKEAGIWICPTAVVFDRPRSDATWRERASFIPPDVFARYRRMYPNAEADPRGTPEAHTLFLRVIKALHEGGVNLLLGTDAVKPGTLPGSSLHDELANFVAAGLTPYQALRATTVDAAAFLKHEREFGAVRETSRADLLLLDANPLVDVKNVARMSGIVAHGRWLSAQELNRQLIALRASYRQ